MVGPRVKAKAQALYGAAAPWRADSSCHKATEENPLLLNAWISELGLNRHQAKKICRSCPVKLICLAEALQDPHAEGMRAGYWFSNGKLTAQDRHEIERLYGLTTSRKYADRAPKQLEIAQ